MGGDLPQGRRQVPVLKSERMRDPQPVPGCLPSLHNSTWVHLTASEPLESITWVGISLKGGVKYQSSKAKEGKTLSQSRVAYLSLHNSTWVHLTASEPLESIAWSGISLKGGVKYQSSEARE